MFQIIMCHLISTISWTPTTKAYYPKMSPSISIWDFGKLCCNLQELLPLNFFTILLISCDGTYSKYIWTWSLLTIPSNILIPSTSYICIRITLNTFSIPPSNTKYQYFVLHTIWTVNLDKVWPFTLWSNIAQKWKFL